MRGYRVVRAGRFTFYFRYDQVDPSLLHIYARHLTTEDDALMVFFGSKPEWNSRFNRYENLTDSHGLFWFWRNELTKEVVVISCFRL